MGKNKNLAKTNDLLYLFFFTESRPQIQNFGFMVHSEPQEILIYS